MNSPHKSPAQSSTELSCLTYNIHKGFTFRNQQYVLEEIRQAIRATQVDLVGLQEVVGEHQGFANSINDWHPEGHFEFLADSVWPHYAYGKNAIYQQGHHGNAVLSKYPFLQLRNTDISHSRYSQRGLLHARIQPTGLNSFVNIACVHMGFMPFEQYKQSRQISEWIAGLPRHEPIILMGDFNDWHLRIHRFLLSQHGLREATSLNQNRPRNTYPAKKPILAMDRIYFRGLKLVRSEVLKHEDWATLSDHNPVYAKFLLEF